MEKFKIGKETICFYGKQRGSNTNKFNRVNKLASMYNELHKKFLNMAERGYNSCTENYRCAVATLLLMETGIRVGNETSAEGYNTVPHPHNKDQSTKFVKTYGLTTLLREHVWFTGANNNEQVLFKFAGKKQVDNTFKVPTKLNKYIKSLYNCGNEPVFGITDYQLTKFIKTYVGKQFTPKDFRTLRANYYAEKELTHTIMVNGSIPVLKKDKKALIKLVATEVSIKLNNTPGVCIKSYINADLFTENL